MASEEWKGGPPSARTARHRTRLVGLVERNRHTMVRFVHSQLASGLLDAEDAVQDALVVLLERVRVWPDSETETLAIVLHHSKNVARNRSRRNQLRSHFPLDNHEPATTADPWLDAWRIRVRRCIFEALEGLTEAEHSVITMWLSGMSYLEIAHHRDCSVNTVKVLLRRARLRLQEALEAVARDKPDPSA